MLHYKSLSCPASSIYLFSEQSALSPEIFDALLVLKDENFQTYQHDSGTVSSSGV